MIQSKYRSANIVGNIEFNNQQLFIAELAGTQSKYLECFVLPIKLKYAFTLIGSLKLRKRKYYKFHMRSFTSTVPARGARAPNRAISNSCL